MAPVCLNRFDGTERGKNPANAGNEVTRRMHVRKQQHHISRKAGAFIAGALMVALGGSAWAYFAMSTGTSNFAVGGTKFTVTIASAIGPALTPGGGTDSMTFSVVNNQPFAQTLTSVSAALKTDGAGGIWDSTVGAFNDSCPASDFDLSFSPAGLPQQLASNGGSYSTATSTAEIDISMPAMAQTDESACEGTNPEIVLTAQ